jgi:hypothetical protein
MMSDDLAGIGVVKKGCRQRGEGELVMLKNVVVGINPTPPPQEGIVDSPHQCLFLYLLYTVTVIFLFI